MDQGFPRKRGLTPSRWDRRRFLKAAVSAASIAASPTNLHAAARTARETVLIVGAGLAGLCAAYRLREAGKQVIVIEARPVPGGRVRTLRGYFDDGIYAELGAARVAESHEYVLTWLNELGLSLTPFAPAGAGIQVLGTHRARSDDEAARERLAPDLHRDERGLTSGELLRKYTEGVPDELGHPDVDLSNPRWRQFDALTWPAWLAAQGASKGAAQLMMLGGDSSDFSALFLLQQIMLHRDLRQYYKIAGGMDLLPRGIAARLTDVIRYNCELVRLERNGVGLRAIYKQEGRMDRIAADRVVLAIPFSTLKHVALDPPFSPAKMRILAELPYYEGTRFLLQTKTRFWQAAGLTGGARTDGPADIWDMSFGQRGGRGLISLTTGNALIEQKLAAMNPAARLGFGIALAAPSFPEINASVDKSTIQRWTEEPYARGAFVVFKPGQMTRWASVLSRSEGRVYFAGEHTAPWNGWMEGALWSGERAAQEILQQ
jgi:monoamine oxidase